MHQQVEHFNNCTLCPCCSYVFCIYLRTNSNLCHLQHKLIGFYNREVLCFLRSTGWICMYISRPLFFCASVEQLPAACRPASHICVHKCARFRTYNEQLSYFDLGTARPSALLLLIAAGMQFGQEEAIRCQACSCRAACVTAAGRAIWETLQEALTSSRWSLCRIVMRRITTFRSTTDSIYDGDPIIF
jgi:hypothetical protein